MAKFNSLIRVFFTVGVSLLLADSVWAQSVLNFSRTTFEGGRQTGISVANPTSSHADVTFTLYGSDGLPASGGANPVSYRVAPRAQLQMTAGEMFAADNVSGWIQATSSTSGLRGFNFSGDFQTSLEGSGAVTPHTQQVIPFIHRDTVSDTEVVVVNPNAVDTTFTLTFFNAAGGVVWTENQSLAPHAVARMRPFNVISSSVNGILSARVNSSWPVSATAVVSSGAAVMFVSGQSIEPSPATLVAPYFVSGSGAASLLVLNNSSGSPVSANVGVFGNAGAPNASSGLLSVRNFSIPAYGSVQVEPAVLMGTIFAPLIDGWLQIDSPDAAVNGVVIVEQGSNTTAIPFDSKPSPQLLYSQILESETVSSAIVLVNPFEETAQVDLYLVKDNGRTVAQNRLELQANSRYFARLVDLIPAAATESSGFVIVRSSRAIYGLAIRGSSGYLATISDMDVTEIAPNPMRVLPKIDRVEPGVSILPGTAIRVTASNTGSDASFLLDGREVPSRLIFPDTLTYEIDVPSLGLGFASLTLRSGGAESEPVTLLVSPPDAATATRVFTGRAFYQKIEVTDAGLDLNRPVMLPIRNAQVEVVDRVSQGVVAASRTDEYGRFRVPVPAQPDLTIRVRSQLAVPGLIVADNTNGNSPYGVAADIDGRSASPNVVLADRSRVSGAFNLLEVIQRGNDALRLVDPTVAPPDVTILWSILNTRRGSGRPAEGLVGATFFSLSNNFAFVLGDRADDSDEYDDSVILHEYAHLLAVRFSRDDSPGGSHSTGDMLDPRVAWSEGWANFFSGAIRNDPIYRDSMGPNGMTVLRYNLEEDIPSADRPGYGSEASVHSLLWDLFDGQDDGVDSVRFPLSLIWNAFSALRNDRFVYLPHFLERFLERAPLSADALRRMVQSRSIDFQPGVRPSVSNPFPRPINVGDAVTGQVDSLSRQRNNLADSSHFMSFTTQGGGTSIRLDIIGLGPGDNPGANDLDIFLYDAAGHLIARSDRGLNGQSEMISLVLAAGAYVVEVRSFYTSAETNTLVFNSGRYRLTVAVQ